ncbi:hypothetical protein D3C78_481290 [compost metagenome]
MGFVDDDAVEGVDWRRIVRLEDAPHHGLHGGNLDARLGLGGHIAEFLDVVDLRQGVVLLQGRLVEGLEGLLAEGAAVDQKEDAAEAFGLQQAIHQADDGARLAGTGGHGQQALPAVGGQRLLYRPDGVFLVVTQLEVGEAFLLEPDLSLGAAALEQVEQAVRGVEVLQRPAQVGWTAQVAEPDAGLLGELLDVGPAVAGEGERHAELAALPVRPAIALSAQQPGRLQLALDDQLAGVALGLWDAVGDVDALALGLDDGHRG